MVAEEDPFYVVKVDDVDKYIRCIHLVSKDGDDSQELWINDDPKNPIILKMKLDFAIELKQVLYLIVDEIVKFLCRWIKIMALFCKQN